MFKRVLALTAAGATAAAVAVAAHAAIGAGAAAPDFTAPATLGGKEFTFSLKAALKKSELF